MFYSLSSSISRILLISAVLFFGLFHPAALWAASPAGSYDDLFRSSASKTSQAITHESIVSFSIDGFPESVRKQIPGASAKGPITVLDLWARYSGYNSHMRMKGVFAAQVGANQEQGFELIYTNRRTYIHGPAPQIGAPENRWYKADQYSGYSGYFTDLYVLQMLAENNLRLPRGGDEKIDNLQCGIYKASDKKAARAAMLALLGGDVDEAAAGVQVVKPDLRAWICSDGYIHQITVSFDLSCTCDDGDVQAGPVDRPVAYHTNLHTNVPRSPNTLSYTLKLRYANMNR